MVEEKWTIIQPTHIDKRLIPSDAEWSNDSFNNLSKLFQARLYHINHDAIDDIEEDSDVYFLISYNINLIDKEIDFLKRMKEKGAKTIVGFSQDRRFLLGHGLTNVFGTSYIDLCEVVDAIGLGVSTDLKFYGRFQHKTFEMGEILEPLNFSIPYEDREIDFTISGAMNGYTSAFEVEFMEMIAEKYPDKRLVICLPDEVEFKKYLIEKHPNIEFPSSAENPLLHFMKNSKAYCNLELRPRAGRTLMESYYCRVPFISSAWTYFSKLCPDFTYSSFSVVDMFNKYELLLNSDSHKVIKYMEEKAEYDLFDNVYKRIKEKLGEMRI